MREAIPTPLLIHALFHNGTRWSGAAEKSHIIFCFHSFFSPSVVLRSPFSTGIAFHWDSTTTANMAVGNEIVFTASWDAAGISWVLTSTALVFMMTLGLAFFYGSLCRDKHIIDTLTKTCIVMGIISVQWVLFGYSFAFGGDSDSAFWGNFYYGGLNNVHPQVSARLRLPKPMTCKLVSATTVLCGNSHCLLFTPCSHFHLPFACRIMPLSPFKCRSPSLRPRSSPAPLSEG